MRHSFLVLKYKFVRILIVTIHYARINFDIKTPLVFLQREVERASLRRPFFVGRRKNVFKKKAVHLY